VFVSVAAADLHGDFPVTVRIRRVGADPGAAIVATGKFLGPASAPR
jgi:hypothetical protein